MAESSGNLLWDFSLTLYSQPGVPEACLTLQDQHGIDVNLLLWAVWLGVRGHLLSSEELQTAVDMTALWRQEIIIPLRAMRRRLKIGVDSFPSENLYQRLKLVELESERLQQDRLYSLSAAWSGNKAKHHVSENLTLFVKTTTGAAAEQAATMINNAATILQQGQRGTPQTG